MAIKVLMNKAHFGICICVKVSPFYRNIPVLKSEIRSETNKSRLSSTVI